MGKRFTIDFVHLEKWDINFVETGLEKYPYAFKANANLLVNLGTNKIHFLRKGNYLVMNAENKPCIIDSNVFEFLKEQDEKAKKKN